MEDRHQLAKITLHYYDPRLKICREIEVSFSPAQIPDFSSLIEILRERG